MENKLLATVRYVKNGRGGQWWPAAKANGQLHAGWDNIPDELLLNPNFAKIKRKIRTRGGQGVTQDFNALRTLLDAPSQHLWITFEEGCMWWCTILDGAVVNPDGQSSVNKGHFWLVCNLPWSNRSLNGKLLAMTDLPGTATTVAGFKGTVCEPRAWLEALRIIQDKKDPDTVKAAAARGEYVLAVNKIVKRLPWQDFERLIDLILIRTGWARISTLGKQQKAIDIAAENPAVHEIAFVQVKSTATQAVLDEYVEQFKQQRDFYARMIFAVHSPSGNLVPPTDLPVILWTNDQVSLLVVRLGLGEWVESRLA